MKLQENENGLQARDNVENTRENGNHNVEETSDRGQKVAKKVAR